MWQRAALLLGKFAASRSGVVSALFGIMLIPLVLSVGVAVDYSRALIVKQHLGRALDSAGPGPIPLTRMCGASARASVRVSVQSADFETV